MNLRFRPNLTIIGCLLLLIGGITIGSFVVVHDELISLTGYNGIDSLYPYPLIGTYHIYNAESIADIIQIGGTIIACLGFGLVMYQYAMNKRSEIEINSLVSSLDREHPIILKPIVKTTEPNTSSNPPTPPKPQSTISSDISDLDKEATKKVG